MNFPSINLRRTYLIARRDYLGYIKTWGFWISFFMPFVFGILGFFLSNANLDVQPIRYETILDETGTFAEAILEADADRKDRLSNAIVLDMGKLLLNDADAEELERIAEDTGADAARQYLESKSPRAAKRIKLPDNKTIFIDPPANNIEDIKTYLRGDKFVSYEGQDVKLNGVLHIYNNGTPTVNYWSPNFNNKAVQSMAERYFRDAALERYLESGGLSRDGFDAAREGTIKIATLDPNKVATADGEGQEVTLTDRIPLYVAIILAVVLWLTVFSGSYMLLTSMLEEKLNKLLEMMLASTRFSEIMMGKLLGVAALTVTALAPYILVGIGTVIGLIFFGDPEISAGLTQAFTPKMMIFFFIFLVLGYVFYGAFFIALGALAESMQDAQTLTTPIMLILTSCLMVVPISLESPDSPIITFASWFPLSAPFAAIIRLPSDPPLWELCLSAFFLFLCALGVVWVAGRIFRYGVLSGSGVKGIKPWFMKTVLRRSA